MEQKKITEKTENIGIETHQEDLWAELIELVKYYICEGGLDPEFRKLAAKQYELKKK